MFPTDLLKIIFAGFQLEENIILTDYYIQKETIFLFYLIIF